MKLRTLLLLVPLYLSAQTDQTPFHFPQQQVNHAVQEARDNSKGQAPVAAENTGKLNGNSSMYQYLCQLWPNRFGRQTEQRRSEMKSYDTLWVGQTGNDTVRITGTSLINGPIAVVNNGVLIL